MDPARLSGLPETPAGHLSGGPAFVPSSGLSGSAGSSRLSGVPAPTGVRPPPLPTSALDAARRADAIAGSGGLDPRDPAPLAHRPLSAAPALTAFRHHPVGSAFLSAPSPATPIYPPITYFREPRDGSMSWRGWVVSVEKTEGPFNNGFGVMRSPQGVAVFSINPLSVRISYATSAPSTRLPWEVYKEIIKSNQNPFPQGAQIVGFGPEREITSITFRRT